MGKGISWFVLLDLVPFDEAILGVALDKQATEQLLMEMHLFLLGRPAEERVCGHVSGAPDVQGVAYPGVGVFGDQEPSSHCFLGLGMG